MYKLVEYPTTCTNRFIDRDGFCNRCSNHHFKFILQREGKRGRSKGGLVSRKIYTHLPGDRNRVFKVLYPNNLRPEDLMRDFFRDYKNCVEYIRRYIKRLNRIFHVKVTPEFTGSIGSRYIAIGEDNILRFGELSITRSHEEGFVEDTKVCEELIARKFGASPDGIGAVRLLVAHNYAHVVNHRKADEGERSHQGLFSETYEKIIDKEIEVNV